MPAGLSEKAQKRLASLAAELIPEGQSLTLCGYRTEQKRIRWIFPRSIDQHAAQRWRNILTNDSALS